MTLRRLLGPVRCYSMVILPTVMVFGALAAQGQSKCEAGRIKSAGKAVLCLMKASARAERRGVPLSPTDVTRCTDKFDLKCGQAEANNDCPLGFRPCSTMFTYVDQLHQFLAHPNCLPAPPDLRAWWPLDELGIARDLAGVNDDGLFEGGPTQIAGKVGIAREFDGIDDDVKAHAIFPHDPTQLTIDAWINPDTTLAPADIVSWNNSDYDFFVTNLAELQFTVQCPGAPISAFARTSGAAITPNVWTHVAVVLDQTANTTTFYVNGVAQALDPGGELDYPDYLPLCLGGGDWRIGTGLAGFFDGGIDEVEIFERALVAQEIVNMVQISGLGKCKPCQ